MARQLGAVRFIGRLANTVGYKARDGKGDAFDAMREHTVDVANPQTLAQMSQRMKLTPVQNFYRGLAGLLDHSWQGVKYGNPSRLHFYSLALRALSTAGCPYVNKGDRKFVPWRFPISSGSLPVSVNILTDNFSDGNLDIEVEEAPAMSATTTIAQLTGAMKDIFGVEAGMQMTFIFVYVEGQQFVPLYKRVILSDTDTTLLTDCGIQAFADAGDSVIHLQSFVNGTWRAEGLAAAGVIVSNKVGEVWQRNTANLVVDNSIITAYNSENAYNNMLESYRSSTNSESPWYLNEGSEEVNEGVVLENDIPVPSAGANLRLAYYQIGETKYIPYFIPDANVKGYRKGGPKTFTKVNATTMGTSSNFASLKQEMHMLHYEMVDQNELSALVPGLTWVNA